MSDDPSESRSIGSVSGRDGKGRFAQGNPGKRPGTRLRVTRAIADLLDGQAEALTQKAVEMALAGDTVAMRLCLERLIPPVKSRPAEVELPELKTAQDILGALGAIAQAVAAGGIDVEQAQGLANVIETYRKGVETLDHEGRIKRLEDLKK